MKNLKRVAFVTCMACVLAVGFAHAGDWQNIGKQTLLFKADTDVIKVKNSDMACSQIMLKVSTKAIKVTDVKIVFDDGTAQEVALNEQILPGAESSAIKIEGAAKKIATVEFSYAPSNGLKNGRAFITLAGTV